MWRSVAYADRVPSLRWIALPLVAAALLSGCSGSDSGLSTGDDVVNGLTSAGIPCLSASNAPEVDTSAKERGIAYIQCDTFGVMLITDRDKYGTVENCQGTELLDWGKADKQRVIVGPNFVITPLVTGDEDIPAFTADASSEKLISEFGGEEVSVTDWMTSQGCVRPVDLPAPSPSTS